MSKIIIVTGASSGIGKSIAQLLSSNGFMVYGTCRDPKKYNITDFNLLQCDINNNNEIKDFIKYVISKEGRVDVLINNAGNLINKPFSQTSFHDFESIYKVNVFGLAELVRQFIPYFCKSSHVINISSIHARATKSNFIAYATSKAAISGMNRALAIELGSSISFYCIEPAAVLTEMLKAGFVNAPSKLNQLAACHPSGEISTPDQLSELIYFLYDKRIPALQGTAIEFGGGISGRLFDPA